MAYNPNLESQYPEWLCRRIADQGLLGAATVLAKEAQSISSIDPVNSALLSSYKDKINVTNVAWGGARGVGTALGSAKFNIQVAAVATNP